MRIDRAIEYLKPRPYAFWRWDDRGETLTWAAGATIAFRPEVERVLERLSPRGLPPFGAVALMLGACREGWRRDPSVQAMRSETEEYFRRHQSPGGSDLHGWITGIFRGLDAILELPPELRTNVESKALLAEVVFEPFRDRGSPEDAAAVVQALDRALFSDALEVDQVQADLLLGLEVRDLAALHRGLQEVSAEKLSLLARTGLDRLVEPEREELMTCDLARSLIAELLDDRELSGLARLARNLMAAVHIPRSISQEEELPLGGFSDISQRGPLDRLLLSELAQDDLTLSVRIALKEALYLRRESPPRSPPAMRALLLDAGVRSWGVPRVFATAAALALVATTGGETIAFRASGERLQKVDLTTREGLVSHLEALETECHPGAAIPAFRRAAGEAGAAELALVVQEDVLLDPEFADSLEDPGPAGFHAITVARDGRLAILQITPAGRKILRNAAWNLDEVLEPAEPGRKPVLPVEDGERDRLPAIFRVKPFPFLLPHLMQPDHAFYSRALGVVGITRDGRLLRWDRKGRGGRQLSQNIPRGKVHWISRDEAGRIRAVIGSKPFLLDADPEGEECIIREIPAPRPDGLLSVMRRGSMLFLIYPEVVRVVSLESGLFLRNIHFTGRISSVLPNHLYFRKNDEFHTVVHNGHTGLIAPFSPGMVPGENYRYLFDRAGMDGPWGITTNKRIFSTVDGSEVPVEWRSNLPARFRVQAISRDGHRILLYFLNGGKKGPFALLDLERNSCSLSDYSFLFQACLEPEIRQWTGNSIELRIHFKSVLLDRQGRLCLISRKGFLLSLGLDSFQKLSLIPRTRDGIRGKQAVAFKPVTSPAGARFRLLEARWKAGGSVFLDSRGLLHLKSARGNLPEISLVLHQDHVAGWTTDGHVCGPEYITGRNDRRDQVIAEAIMEFARRLG